MIQSDEWLINSAAWKDARGGQQGYGAKFGNWCEKTTNKDKIPMEEKREKEKRRKSQINKNCMDYRIDFALVMFSRFDLH